MKFAVTSRMLERALAEVSFYEILRLQAEMTDSPHDAACAASATKILHQKELVDSLPWGSIYRNLTTLWLNHLIRSHIMNYGRTS